MASPSPVPPKVRVVDASAWRNGSNSRSSWSWRMPIPESVTSTPSSTPAGSRAGDVRTDLTSPTLVNLIALETRLESTWPSRVGSPTRRVGHRRPRRRPTDRSPCAAADSARIAAVCVEHRADLEVHLLELELAGLDLGEVEDVVDDAQQGAAGALDALGQAPLVVGRGRCAAAAR